ncbi:tyrosine-type recombinase/integrase [candidate division WWE3 bacterium]|nr:tyrosine-type recombinase/integrase [candidate division WWE3 bacterium]
MNLKEARKQFVKYLEELGRANSTLIAYSKDIEQLANFMEKNGITDPNDVSLEDLEDFMEHFAEKGYTNKTISRKTNSTKTFFSFLDTKRYVSDDPASRLEHPEVKVSPPRILSALEYRALRDVARGDLRTYALIEVFLQTGISISEIAGIKLAHLHMDTEKTASTEGKDPYLYIPARGSKNERTVPLNEIAQAAIKRYIDEGREDQESEFLFITRTGNPMLVRNIRSTINRYFEKADIDDATVNDLRHTFIAQQLKNDVSLAYVSKVVGHKRVSTTERYLEYAGVEESGQKVELVTL